MPGNYIGGLKARDKNLLRNPNFYVEIGRIGGAKGGATKGFGSNKELAKIAGAKGGRVSKRGSNLDVLRSMNVGESIFFKGKGRLEISNRFHNSAVRAGMSISVTTEDNGVRMERTA